MSKTIGVVVALVVGVSAILPPLSLGQSTEPPEMPPSRAIPGITTEDPFPRGCVDCHINYTDLNMDTRISTLMRRWTQQVDAAVLEVARAVAGPDARLTGVHPSVDQVLDDIPASCLVCHPGDASDAVPLAPLLHRIHFAATGESVFLRLFQGECTHCHKFDAATGEFRVPSGPE